MSISKFFIADHYGIIQGHIEARTLPEDTTETRYAEWSDQTTYMSHYIENSQLMPRTTVPITADKSIVAVGELLTFSNVPLGSNLFIYRKNFEENITEYLSLQESIIEITFNNVANYVVIFSKLPHIDFKMDISCV